MSSTERAARHTIHHLSHAPSYSRLRTFRQGSQVPRNPSFDSVNCIKRPVNILVWRAVQRESLTRQGSKAGKIRVRTGRESVRLRWEPKRKSSSRSGVSSLSLFFMSVSPAGHHQKGGRADRSFVFEVELYHVQWWTQDILPLPIPIYIWLGWPSGLPPGGYSTQHAVYSCGKTSQHCEPQCHPGRPLRTPDGVEGSGPSFFGRLAVPRGPQTVEPDTELTHQEWRMPSFP